jgi:hypothetical protein
MECRWLNPEAVIQEFRRLNAGCGAGWITEDDARHAVKRLRMALRRTRHGKQ